MKRLILIVGVLAMIGAGCSKADIASDNVPDTDLSFSATEWFITGVDQDWYAYEEYEQAGNPFGIGKERSTDRFTAQAFLQNVDKPILLPERPALDGYDYYDGDDWVLLDVLVYPEAAQMPKDLDLVDVKGKNIGVRRQSAFDTWYWKTDEMLFEIFFYAADGNNVTPEEVFSDLKLQ